MPGLSHNYFTFSAGKLRVFDKPNHYLYRKLQCFGTIKFGIDRQVTGCVSMCQSLPGKSLYVRDSRKSAGVMKYCPSNSMEANCSNLVFRLVCE